MLNIWGDISGVFVGAIGDAGQGVLRLQKYYLRNRVGDALKG